MDSPSNACEPALRRHDLVFVSGAGWRSVMAFRPDLGAEPLVAGWVDRGWPLVARRPLTDERQGIALGLPLPPSAGKRRLDIVLMRDDIVSVVSPLPLHDAVDAAPPGWQATLAEVMNLGRRHGIEPRVFGSLAWRVLTGLDYLSVTSDLDLLLPIARGSDPLLTAAELAEIESAAPMRLDGELVREDGAAVNWRELQAGAPDVLVKTLRDVTLLQANQFCLEATRS